VKTATTAIERVVVLVVALAVAIGVIALLSGGLFTGQDSADVAGTVRGPGQAFPDLGRATLPSRHPQITYNSSPPTSGPHAAEPVSRDEAALGDDQLLQALQVGDVVLMYGTPAPPAGLPALARALAPPFSPALAASGQAVILARRSGLSGVVGLAWDHMLRSRSAADAELKVFANFWLGRGAPKR
jgi:uncharacterized protein DUF3105